MVCPPLPTVFGSSLSVNNHGKPDNNAFALRCNARNDDTVTKLRQALGRALRRAGLLHAKPTNTRHRTMLYDQRVVLTHPIKPQRWTLTRLALVLSYQGLTHHEWKAKWQLA